MALTKNNIRDIKINLPLPFLSNVILVCLMLSVSLFVCAESEQEIGVPVIENYIAPHLSVMAPEGERMYVLSQGALTLYNLNPLEIISSVKVDFSIPKSKIPSSTPRYPGEEVFTGARLFVTKDEQNIIVYSHNKMTLFDINKKKTIKTVKFGAVENIGILNGNEFVIFDDENKITIFDAGNLNELKKISSSYNWSHYYNNTQGDVTSHGLRHYRNQLNKLGDYIFLYKYDMPFFSNELMIIDASSYNLVYSFKGATLEGVFISYDLKTLYLRNVRYVYGSPLQENPFIKKYKGSYLGIGEKYNLETKEINQVTKEERYMYRRNVIPLTREAEFFMNDRVAYRKTKAIFLYKGIWAKKKLLQFNDNEAILFRSKTKSFQLTPNAREHIRMKNATGKMVPINDATFNKFNKFNINPMEW